MLIVSYDISNTKVRTSFSKFLKKYGVRLQFSVYECTNSQRILDVILKEVELYYKKYFTMADSVIIFNVGDKNMIKYGHAVHREQSVVYID
jgi:CRISPR-associated endonuclease Cas2